MKFNINSEIHNQRLNQIVFKMQQYKPLKVKEQKFFESMYRQMFEKFHQQMNLVRRN